MLKGKAKNAIIFLCILNALFLTGKIWFNEKLWSSDYNFFVFQNPLKIFSSWFPKEESYSMPKENLSKPRKIVVNSGSEMTVYYNSAPNFASINESVQAVLTAVLSDSHHMEEASAEEWYEALYEQSVYAEYSLSYTPELFAQISGIKETGVLQGFDSVRDYVFVPQKDGTVLFYMRDAETNAVKKLTVTPPDGTDFSYLKQTAPEDELYFFAFDLGLSAKEDEEGKPMQSVILSPMVLISAQEIPVQYVQSSNPMISSSGMLETETVSRILARFGCSSRTSRHYTDASGTQVYVENNGTLKLYTSGLIEYEALSPDMGIDISDAASGNSLYASLNSAIDFVESVWAEAVPSEPLNVCVSGDLKHARQESGAYKFTFDYYVAGNPVETALSERNGHAAMNRAVEVCVYNGKITAYRHFIRKFKTGEEAEMMPMIDALNQILKRESGSGIITDMYLSYLENGSGRETLPEWCAKFQDSDATVRYRGEGTP